MSVLVAVTHSSMVDYVPGSTAVKAGMKAVNVGVGAVKVMFRQIDNMCTAYGYAYQKVNEMSNKLGYGDIPRGDGNKDHETEIEGEQDPKDQ